MGTALRAEETALLLCAWRRQSYDAAAAPATLASPAFAFVALFLSSRTIAVLAYAVGIDSLPIGASVAVSVVAFVALDATSIAPVATIPDQPEHIRWHGCAGDVSERIHHGSKLLRTDPPIVCWPSHATFDAPYEDGAQRPIRISLGCRLVAGVYP